MPDQPPGSIASSARLVPAAHARRAVEADSAWELGLAAHLRATLDAQALAALAVRHATGTSEFDHLGNAEVALRVFEFAASAADYRTAWSLLRQLETRLRDRVDDSGLKTAQTYREAHQALRSGDYGRARALFEDAFKNRLPDDQDRLIMVFLDRLAVSRLPGNEREAQSYEAALRKLAAPES
ncbi:MAG: hypothetical protein IT562_07145 [Alphaproteobacteria bacterium]|nr:hypothetical protein [Alphaproteobacteria bacterium]